MKQFKKLLSVVLAIMMVVTSVSVCFTSFAAGSASDAQWDALITALKADDVKNTPNYTTGSAGNYTIKDKTGNILTAMDAYWSVFESVGDKSPTVNQNRNDGNRTATMVRETIKTNLSTKMGSTDYAAYNVANVINAFSADCSIEGGKDGTKDLGSPSVTVKIVSVKPLLAYDTIAEIPDSVNLGKTYTVKHSDGTYDVTTSGCGGGTTIYHYLKISETTTSTSDPVDTRVMKNAANYFSENEADFTTWTIAYLVNNKTEAELNTYSNDIHTNYNTFHEFGKDIGLEGCSKALEAKYYSQFDINVLIDLIDSAAAVIPAKAIADELLVLIPTDYSEYNKAQLDSLYGTIEGKYESYEAQPQDAKDYVENEMGYADKLATIKAVKADILHKIELIELKELKAQIEADLDIYNAYTKQQVADSVVTGATLAAAKGKVFGYIDALKTYVPATVDEVFGAGYSDNNLSECVARLDELLVISGYVDDFSAKYAYYISTVYGSVSANERNLQTYDSWYTELNALIGNINGLSPELAASILRERDTVMKEFMDSKYAVLNAIVTAQIDTAYETYNYLNTYYELKLTIVNIETFRALQQSIGLIDTGLYNFLMGSNNFAVPAETQAKYNALKSLVIDFENFKETYGLNTYYPTDYSYADREVYENDFVKDKTYNVNDEGLKAVIDGLDKVLTSDAMAGILGSLLSEDGSAMSLKDLLADKIGGIIYSDKLINTLVGLLYPLILNMLYDVVNEKASILVGSVPDITKQVKLYIYPSQLAGQINKQKYSEAYNALNSVPDTIELDGDGNKTTFPWNNSAISTDGTLTIKWGVDEASPENKADAFYDALAEAMKGLAPLVYLLFCNKDFSGSATVAAVGKLTLKSSGINGYVNTLAPIFELLNYGSDKIRDAATMAGYAASGNLNGIARAIFEPIMDFVEKLGDAPVDTLMAALPNICYALETGMIKPLLNMLSIVLVYKASAVIFDIASGEEPISLGDLLVGGDGISIGGKKIDLANLTLSSLLSDVLGIALPAFNEAEVATFGELKTHTSVRVSAIYGDLYQNNKAYYIDADKEGLAYCVLKYLFNLLSNETAFNAFIDSLVPMLVKSDDFVDEETGELNEEAYNEAILAKAEELKETIGGILAMLNLDSTGDAVAAVVELFKPDKFSAMPMTWADADFSYSTDINDFDSSSIPYLQYANDWTRDKAVYLMDNIDSVIASVIKMTGGDETTVGAMIAEKISALYTNETITKLATALVGLGYNDMDELITALLSDGLGLDLRTWAATFPELYVAPEAEEAEEGEEGEEATETPAAPDFTAVAKLEGISYADGVWTVGGTALKDGDSKAFAKALAALLSPFAKYLSTLLGGKDLKVLDALVIPGYNNYNSSVGLLLEALGIDATLTADFATAPAAALEEVIVKVLNKLDALTGENFIKNVVELLPNIVYFLKSNGLTVVLYNLLEPVLAVVDTVRPIIDIDLNKLVSVILTDVLSDVRPSLAAGKLAIDFNIENILSAIKGEEVDTTYAVNLKKLDIDTILRIVDTLLGTSLSQSALNKYGIAGLCSAKTEKADTSVGTICVSAMEPADTFTVLVTSIIEALQDKCYLEGGVEATNADVIITLVQKLLGAESDVDVAKIYNTVINVINGFEIGYEVPTWGYMFGGGTFTPGATITLPPHTVNYLQYDNDYDKDTAKALDKNFDALVDYILSVVLKDNTIAGLINGILEDNVYTDANLAAVVELLVNLLANLDSSLYNTIGAVVDVKINDWFAMCTPETDEEGKVTYKCTKSWNVDESADKKATFIAAVKEVLTPAYDLISLIFFGTSYNFFTGSEKNADGTYKYNDIITINGGQGYAYGIVPVLEALGCEDVKAADSYKKGDAYDVGAAIDDILAALFGRIDDISGKPAHVVLNLLPNIIYFLNANGIKAVVNSILAPIDALVGEVAPLLGKEAGSTLGSLLVDTLDGINLSNLDIDVLLKLIIEKTGLNISEDQYKILRSFYIGELTQFESANGEYAYKMTYTDKETRADMITIVLSFAVELFKQNGPLFESLLTAEQHSAIVTLLGGATELVYAQNDWDYMGEEIFATLTDKDVDAIYNDLYNKYANDWTQGTAIALDKNIEGLIKFALEVMKSKDSTLGIMIKNALSDNLYSDELLDSIVVTVVGALKGLDQSLVESVGAVLGAEIKDLYAMVDEDGNCKVEWNITDAESFAAALETALAPANRILSWFFFGDDYKFLNDATGEDLIKIKGGEAYKYAIVPVLEALGCEYKTADNYSKDNASEAVNDVVKAILTKVEAICDSETMVDEVLDLVANVIYFVNAGGIQNTIDNLLAPVNYLLVTLEPITGKEDFKALIKDLAGFDLDSIGWDMIFDLVEGLGITLTASAKEFIETFYTSDVVKTANGYRVALNEKSRADMITIILGIALETFKNADNAEKFEELIGNEALYNTIIAVLNGAQEAFVYADPDWAYMYGEGSKDKLASEGLPSRTELNEIIYILYTNNWNDATAQYLSDNLDKIIDNVVAAIAEDKSSLGDLLAALVNDNLYSDAVLNSLVEIVVGALKGLDQSLVNSVGAVLGAEVDKVYALCDDEGKCTKVWNVTDAESFAAAFKEAIAPANRILSWIFFGQDYKFLNSSTEKDLITIKGGEGYAYTVVPVLEALGCEPLAASEYKTEKGYNATQAVYDVLMAVTAILDDVCAGNSVDKVLDLILNVVYFINAGGLKTAVQNILQPVYFLLKTLEPVVGEVDLAEVIGYDIENIDFNFIFDLVADMAGIKIDPTCKEFISTFYMGEAESFTSANGREAYKLNYTKAEGKREMMTIILSLLIDNVEYSENKEVLSELLGEDIYDAIINVLGLTEAKAMEEFQWLYKEYANTDKTFTAIESSGRYSNPYNDIWTREMAQYIADNFPDFVDKLLCLLGLESDGVEIRDLEDFIDVFVDGNLYTQANADKIIELLKGLTAKLTTLEPYGEYITAILKTAIEFDITAWDDMSVTVTEGDAASFADALAQIIAPAAPLLKVLLAGEDVKFFYDINDKQDQIVIPGSEGYAYGIIPILEALGCQNILTPDEFKAVLVNDEMAAVKAVVDPIVARIADIEEDPANKILNMLPAVLYFINSKGLDTSVKNIVNTVDTVLIALEPAIGKTSLMQLLGVDLATIDFAYIVDKLLTLVSDKTGYNLSAIAIDAVAELTIGKVVTYDSKNGETYYTMKYYSKAAKADMVTVILRLLVDFVTCDENVDKVKGILAQYISDDKAYDLTCDMVDYLATVVRRDPAMSGVLYVIYYIYYGVDQGVSGADDIYHNINDTWKSILGKLINSDNPIVQGVGNELADILDEYLGGIFDSEGVASEGFITFWQRLINFFKKIVEFIKNLFN